MQSRHACACCGAPFDMNPRARTAHAFCREPDCQRERRRAAQRRRRSGQGRSWENRAAYMRQYRAARPGYRKADAAGRQARRRRERAEAKRAEARRAEAGRAEAKRAVTEAGLEPCRAEVYLSRRLGEVELRAVTEAGFTLKLCVEGGCVCAVTEAGLTPVQGSSWDAGGEI